MIRHKPRLRTHVQIFYWRRWARGGAHGARILRISRRKRFFYHWTRRLIKHVFSNEPAFFQQTPAEWRYWKPRYQEDEGALWARRALSAQKDARHWFKEAQRLKALLRDTDQRRATARVTSALVEAERQRNYWRDAWGRKQALEGDILEHGGYPTALGKEEP